MSVIGFYTDNGKKKPITARKTGRPRYRSPALIRAEEQATKALKEEFPDVSLILVKDKKFIVWIRETKPHSGDCRDCEACQERKKVMKERANQILEKTGLPKKYEFDVVPILKPRPKSKEELERIREFFEDLGAIRAMRRRD